MESPFASWMDRFAKECPEQAPPRDPEDALMASLAKKGYAHELSLKAWFIEQGLEFETIEQDSSVDKNKQTLTLMNKGVDVIAQARLRQDNFAGYADFLVKIIHTDGDQPSIFGDWHYEVWDAKLTSSLKPAFVIQLCCYSDMLESIQGIRPKFITVALGRGQNERLRTNDFFDYYQQLKMSFIKAQQAFNAQQQPDPADSNNWGEWRTCAEQMLKDQDHLLQVATITKSQIKKLNSAGINTMQQLVDCRLDHVIGLNPKVFNTLRAQANIQKRSVQPTELGLPPKFEIIKPQPFEKTGLALLPPHSPQDVFFDIEGYPLEEGGLEYLWGCTYFTPDNTIDFIDFWAHDAEQEKTAFVEFIHWVYQRWQQDSSMHIYHYANYEITACRKLMGRYGICEEQVDQLLRNQVFVDLYTIVKGGVLLGEPRYSIKNVEHLYRGKRKTEVGNGGDSVVVYEQWRSLHQQGEQGNTWQTSSILKSIRDYNMDDCESTQQLTVWLRKQQEANNIAFLGTTDIVEPDKTQEITERTLLRDRLLHRAEQERDTNPAQARLTENLAWFLEFHRREAKPVFWRLFERLGSTDVDLLDDLDCLAVCQRTARHGFKPGPRVRNLAYEYQFNTAQDFKGSHKQYYILGLETEDGKPTKVSVVQDETHLEQGIITLQSKHEPPAVVTLVPDDFINPNPIPQAIEQSVRDYEAGTLIAGNCAILDFLTRAKPRFKDQSFKLDQASASTHTLDHIIQAIKNLDHSYLTIQGPPGAGKTYTGKHVIAKLVQAGAMIGIASNSHKAINNLVLSTAQYCATKNISADFACTKDTDPALLQHQVAIVKNADLLNHIQPGCVIGTTAWGFAREDLAEQLDYLFIDEAGQVAVANLIAMSRAAKNLVFMGDQMQLGQPSQGTHPADSGLSILDYLLRETPTIPEDMGIFLGTTYRMHSLINQFVSKHIYEGKLVSHPDNDQRIIEVPPHYQGPLNQQAGIVFIPVVHQGNTQASGEEAAQIQHLAQSLIGRTFHATKNSTRPIDWQDMLFVAPYNHQVSTLTAALGDKAKVGSVDKFQGQEAPIVFLSMCASDANDSPRGLAFLFDQHRLNVAISRAQTLVIVVGNPKLGSTSVTSVEQLKLVNLFNGIMAAGAKKN